MDWCVVLPVACDAHGDVHLIGAAVNYLALVISSVVPGDILLQPFKNLLPVAGSGERRHAAGCEADMRDVVSGFELLDVLRIEAIHEVIEDFDGGL